MVSLLREEQDRTSKKVKQDIETRMDKNPFIILAVCGGPEDPLAQQARKPLAGFKEIQDCLVFRNNIIYYGHTHNKYMNYYTIRACPVGLDPDVHVAFEAGNS